MKNYNWKDIKKVLKGYSPNNGGFKPILVYGPEFPVRLKSNTFEYLGLESLLEVSSKIEHQEYSFYTSLSQKDNEYEVVCQAYAQTGGGEMPMLHESQNFELNRVKDVEHYLKTPLSYFKMNGHIRLLTFKNTNIEEQEFKEIIELWRTTPSQTQS
jgi:hypothetical protein